MYFTDYMTKHTKEKKATKYYPYKMGERVMWGCVLYEGKYSNNGYSSDKSYVYNGNYINNNGYINYKSR